MMKAEARARLEEEADVKRSTLHEGQIISLTQDRIQYDNGEEKVFDLIFHPGAVAIIPIDPGGNLIFVKQWRRAVRQILIELPAGKLEASEHPDDCAQRELQEEIGYEAKELISLGGFFTAPGFCNEYIYLYLAKDLHHNPLIGDDSDEIDIVSMSLEEALKQIQEGKIIDAKTIAGIYRYRNSL